MISLTSSHVARTKPPRPRTFRYSPRFAGSSWIAAHAPTGVLIARSLRHSFSSRERTSGCFTRLAEYMYQE